MKQKNDLRPKEGGRITIQYALSSFFVQSLADLTLLNEARHNSLGQFSLSLTLNKVKVFNNRFINFKI